MARRKRTELELAFSKTLAQKLTQEDLTLQQAAESAGTSRSVIHGWLCGSIPHDLNAVARLSEALNIPLYKLLFNRDDPVQINENSKKEVEVILKNIKLNAGNNELGELGEVVLDAILQHYQKKNRRNKN